MEFIQGETITRLTRVSRSRARIVPMNVALAIAADMLQGLHAAHEAKDERGEPLGIVHRDISPHNIMVGRDGVSRVLDFGIAKATSSAQSTRDGEVKGKFAYMSPEQLSSVRVDRRADVFRGVDRFVGDAHRSAFVFGVGSRGDRRQGFERRDQTAEPMRAGFARFDRRARAQGSLARSRSTLRDGLDMARAIEKLGIAIARPTEVGTWVNRIAGDALKQRAKRLAEIESTGSFSRDGAANALAMLSQPRIDDTGSLRVAIAIGNASRRIRAVVPERDAELFDVAAAPRDRRRIASARASCAESAVASRAQSHRARRARCALGAFVWRAGGVGPARDRVAQWRHTEPHGEEFRTMRTGTISVSTATPSAVVTAPSASTIDMDIASVPTTTAAVNAPHVWSGGHVSRGHVAPTETANVEPTQNAIVAPTGPVSMRPGQGQVQAALVALLKSARACFNPGDPPSRATVTFQSDGSVKSVAVSGFGAGKPQAACVQGMFGKARVDPFCGSDLQPSRHHPTVISFSDSSSRRGVGVCTRSASCRSGTSDHPR